MIELPENTTAIDALTLMLNGWIYVEEKFLGLDQVDDYGNTINPDDETVRTAIQATAVYRQLMEQEVMKLRELLFEVFQYAGRGAGHWLNTPIPYVPEELRHYINIYNEIDAGLKNIAEWKEKP